VQSLSAQQILQAWERGRDHPPAQRALDLLATALPETGREALAHLTVGERDACLLQLREKTLGPTLRGGTECPACKARLELALAVRDVLQDQPFPLPEREMELAAAGYSVRFRLPDGEDMAAAGACREVPAARALLLARCVLGARRDDGSPVAPAELPAEVVEAIGESMAERDPQALVELRLTCAACAHSWTAVLDVGSFFWTELSALSQRLLHEVHVLARAYGWSEREILAMSAARRHGYIEKVSE
jgi:hypothetical protein